jgi:hypothetical protein
MAKKKSKAGRKPVDDPKVQVSFYPLKSEVEKVGKEKCQEIALKAVQKAAKKIE